VIGIDLPIGHFFSHIDQPDTKRQAIGHIWGVF
jgi:hypothetical protein